MSSSVGGCLTCLVLRWAQNKLRLLGHKEDPHNSSLDPLLTSLLVFLSESVVKTFFRRL